MISPRRFVLYTFAASIILLGLLQYSTHGTDISHIKDLGSQAYEYWKSKTSQGEHLEAEPEWPTTSTATITSTSKADHTPAVDQPKQEEDIHAPEQGLADPAIEPEQPPSSSAAVEQDFEPSASTDSATASETPDEFGGDWWFFQDETHDYRNPEFDVGKLKSYAPHNWKGPGQETYATFLSTRNSSLYDPFFLATQQVTYRLLWDPRSKSQTHPIVVFVAPYISQQQRDYLTAAGAMVREIELIEWHPTHLTTAQPRWREMFTKLNFWKETDFSRILYLDTDAFPLTHMDELFDTAEEQKCDVWQLAPEDQSHVDDICNYVFTAAPGLGDEINAGMMILKPDLAMHARLLRESHDHEKYDQNMVEQAFLTYAFDPHGPFPVQYVERKWNALFTSNDDEGKINVIHEKLWALWPTPNHFAVNYFNDTWLDMLKLYESDEFARLRAADDVAQQHSRYQFDDD